MSTRSGKPNNPIDFSDYEPRLARAAERHPSGNETDPLRSPYAPKRAHKPAGTDRHSIEKDQGALRWPTKARGPAVAPDFVIKDDDEPDRYASASSGGASGRARPLSNDRDDQSSLEKSIPGGHPVDRGAAASFQAAHPIGRHQPPATEGHDEITNDRDLKRLEASLRWLQRQEVATRLPPTTPLPPVPGLAPVDATGRRHSRGLPVDNLRAPRSLEPERLTPPPAVGSHRDNRRWPLAVVLTGIIAAPIAYYFSVGDRGLSPQFGPQTVSFDQTIGAPQSKGAQKYGLTGAQDRDHETSAPTEMPSERTGDSQTAKSSEGETMAMVHGGSIGAPAPSPGKAKRVLDPEEIKLLTQRGQQFAAAGDLVTARILFQRAAEAGDATAAVALGATYDPNVLAELGVLGVGADAEKARSWYRKAESFGSPEASRRLNALANR
jgi:hypothetical protein